jgi:hypothetical protein
LYQNPAITDENNTEKMASEFWDGQGQLAGCNGGAMLADQFTL